MSPTQNKTPVVAAVCDCRTEANPDAHRAPLQETLPVVAAVCDCRKEANLGAHRAPLQETLPVVAAVCDCRTEANPDAHRAPLQETLPVVAAVCDCRKEANTDAHRAPLQETLPVVAAVCDCRTEATPDAHRAPLQMKPRLTRLDRLFVQHPIYFVTACTFNRRSFLACDDVHQAFRHFATAGAARGAWVGRYVFMPDHLHLFVALEAISLSAWMKSLKNALSKTLRVQGHDAPHWQRGFFDHLLRSGESYSLNWTRPNGIMCAKIQSAPAWWQGLKIGPMLAKFAIWSIAANDKDGSVVAAVCDCRSEANPDAHRAPLEFQWLLTFKSSMWNMEPCKKCRFYFPIP